MFLVAIDGFRRASQDAGGFSLIDDVQVEGFAQRCDLFPSQVEFLKQRTKRHARPRRGVVWNRGDMVDGRLHLLAHVVEASG